MTSILIVESNTPDLIRAAREQQRPTPADYFISVFRELATDVEVSVCEPYVEPVERERVERCGAVVFTGSGVDWSTDAPQARPLRDAMELAFSLEKPCWGSCNGLQLAAVVLGGTVGVMAAGREAGIASIIRLSEGEAQHPLMAGRGERFAAPTLHRDEVVTLPDRATLLACNAHCTNQAFAYRLGGVDFWGTQYHPEMRSVDVARCLRRGDAPVSTDTLQLIEDLSIAETDIDASARLSTTPGALSTAVRALELRNWIDYLESGAVSRSAA